ncbi:transferase family-domain-containing protein [Gamsiella multidivaricata]|uniref:transferase family-domain-containing protein n=1 Tax=Gamsiella multidivaricata TaxID=101098 RepID=UPI00221F0B6F|nr:transferase family-domain-containing protein [Gamsiella multidivaricata]KAI7821539.1 transferase family-domain-containing protein [Gamsiella multidivaricata]
MTTQRASNELEKNGSRSLESSSSPSNPTVATGTFVASRSPSSYSLRSRLSPSTRLRYRQLVQPITPTELEAIPETESNASLADRVSSGGMRYPRVHLSSVDLAKPRIYTRLLYFFEASSSFIDIAINSNKNSNSTSASQGSFSPISSSSSSSGSAAGVTSFPVLSPTVTSPPTSKRKAGFKSRHHYHYHQSPFMDPMLLQASLALVLSDFVPLAGRLCNSGQEFITSSVRPYIECNDRGVLFAVADTTVTMEQIRQGDYQDAVLPPHLFPVGLYPASLRDPPLLSVQLTYTQDHSLIMGVAMDSAAMDATSLVSFMDAWSKITQGKDFAPYPILDRSFLEKHGEDHGPNGVYRHQRVNNSPPPPILFDNSLDNELDRGLGEMDLHAENEDDIDSDEEGIISEDKEDGPGRSLNLEQAQRQMQLLHAGSDEAAGTVHCGAADIPVVVVDHAEQLEGPAEDIPDQLDRSQILGSASAETESEGGNLHLFHFTAGQLERIKKLASEQNIAAAACAADDKEISDKWVSTGDSLIAYLWKMSTIARRMEPDCKLMCGVVMDIRNRLKPAIPEGFIGNAILSIFVQMPVHSLLTTPLSLPSRLLRDELLLQTPEQIRSSISWIQKQEYPHLIEADSNNPFGDDFMVWSFRKLSMYSPDFGQGCPTKVRIGQGGFGGGEGMCIIMDSAPSYSGASGVGSSSGSAGVGEAGVDVYLGLQGEHLQDFEKVHRGFMESLLENGGGWEVV